MSNTYLVRAKLAFDLDFEHVTNRPPLLNTPSKVPVILGPFTIDYSPNEDRYLLYLGLIEPDPVKGLPIENYDYPHSMLYAETKIQSPKNSPYIEADEKLNALESLFRLFQTGGIYIGRREIWEIESEKGKRLFSWDTHGFIHEVQFKSEPVLPHERPGYNLNDNKLAGFKHFFEQYYDIIQIKNRPLYIALSRFSSSYEKLSLADRLIDLMIAMEALLGNRTEVTNKISLRFACMLYPPGEAREKAFYAVKKVYDERSNIIHGDRLDTKFSEEEVHNFEEHVRKLIVKFLELCKQGIILDDKNIDKFIFFGNTVSQ